MSAIQKNSWKFITVLTISHYNLFWHS